MYSQEDSLSVIQDTIGIHPLDSLIVKKDFGTDETARTGFVMHKDPMNAILYSLVFPGLGQVYVETYWKAPIFAGAAGTMVYFIFDFDAKYSYWQKKYNILKTENPTSSELSLMQTRKEFYRDNRDRSGFFLLGIYLLAAVDSYVGAHLYDFTVSDDISFNIKPDALRGGVFLQFSFTP